MFLIQILKYVLIFLFTFNLSYAGYDHRYRPYGFGTQQNVHFPNRDYGYFPQFGSYGYNFPQIPHQQNYGYGYGYGYPYYGWFLVDYFVKTSLS